MGCEQSNFLSGGRSEAIVNIFQRTFSSKCRNGQAIRIDNNNKITPLNMPISKMDSPFFITYQEKSGCDEKTPFQNHNHNNQFSESSSKQGSNTSLFLDMATVNELVEDYLDSELQISNYENGDPLTMFYVKRGLAKKLDDRIVEQMAKIEQLENSLSNFNGKLLKRRPTLREILQKYENLQIDKTIQDYIALTNRLEIAVTELEMLNQERALVIKELVQLLKNLTILKEQYQRQEYVLDQLGITDEQQYLSELEYQRIKMSETFARWREGRKLVSEACSLLDVAQNKWLHARKKKMDMDFDTCEEIRDSIIAALQCLSNAKVFIRMDFPYCTGLEIATLEKTLWAMAYIFIDLKSDDRRIHAEQCYLNFHKRAVALSAWLDKTIEFVIEPDLKKLTIEINEKVRELRALRMAIIKEKYPDISIPKEIEESLPNYETLLHQAPSPDRPEIIILETSMLYEELEFDKLAPLPDKDDIFGKNTEKIIEKFKAKLRESFMRKYNARKNFGLVVDQVLSMSEERRNSLFSENNTILMESLGHI